MILRRIFTGHKTLVSFISEQYLLMGVKHLFRNKVLFLKIGLAWIEDGFYNVLSVVLSSDTTMMGKSAIFTNKKSPILNSGIEMIIVHNNRV